MALTRLQAEGQVVLGVVNYCDAEPLSVSIFRNKYRVMILSSAVFLCICSGGTYGLIRREYVPWPNVQY